MGAGGVTYSWATVRKELGGGADVGSLLAFRSGGKRVRPEPEVVAAVAAAVEHANGVVEPRRIKGGPAMATPEGAVIPVFCRSGVRAVVEPWADALIHRLTDAGMTGKLGVPRRRLIPRPAQFGYEFAPTVFVGYRMNEPRARSWYPFMGWSVDEGATERVAEQVSRWGPRDRPHTQCQARLYTSKTVIDFSDDAGFLRFAAENTAGIATLSYLDPDPHPEPTLARYAAIGPYGRLAAQSVSLHGTWEQTLADLRDILLAAPEATDVAFVKNTWCGINLWEAVQKRGLYQPVTRLSPFLAPGVREHWDQITMDAHPVNLLTDAHLDRAHDLTDWTIEQVAPGRHLVTAKNLEPWFTGGSPPEDILVKARADFGDMIYRTPTG